MLAHTKDRSAAYLFNCEALPVPHAPMKRRSQGYATAKWSDKAKCETSCSADQPSLLPPCSGERLPTPPIAANHTWAGAWVAKPTVKNSKHHQPFGGHFGGEGGIRTPDRLAPMPHFECGTFNHSATSPGRSESAVARGWLGGVLGEVGAADKPPRTEIWQDTANCP